MKKTALYLLIIVIISSCVDSNPVTITSKTNLRETIVVSIPQTSGTAISGSNNLTQDLNDLVSNLTDVTDITIDALNYQFNNFYGNTNAVLESFVVTINGIEIANQSNINIAQEVNSQTVFSITDANLLNQIETLILNNSTVDITFSSSILSDEGSATFDIDLAIDLSVVIN